MPEPLDFPFLIPLFDKVQLLARLFFLSQALAHFLGKGVEKFIFLPFAIHTGKTQETAQFAVWEGMSRKETGGHKPAMDAEENTSLLWPQKSWCSQR